MRLAMNVLAALCVCAVAVGSVLPNRPLIDQHPQFHPAPEYNWMNDPNGPVYYNGIYHLFFQYNPNGATWGDMSWGHIVSEDLIFWMHLPVALYPDQPYDAGGVFSGSATVLDDNSVVIAYTCVASDGSERQCLAYPADPTDKYLVQWVKDKANPVIANAPTGGNLGSFRDDTTAWKAPNGNWVMAVGVSVNNQGGAMLYQSADFKSWSELHMLWTNAQHGGMWECPDVYVAQPGNSSSPYVVKLSSAGDWYAIGQLDQQAQLFTPQSVTRLYDGGQFYASKRFYDPVQNRQVLFGWVAEEDNSGAARGWQGVQSFPRHVIYDAVLNALTYQPIDEIELLRTGVLFNGVVHLDAGSEFVLPGVEGMQLEIQVSFNLVAANATGKFGVSVHRSLSGSEHTDISIQSENLGGPLNNTDMPGAEYRQFTYDASTPTEQQRIALCRSTCVAGATSQGCVAWTYVRQGGEDNDPSPRCSLKNAIPPMNPNVLCVSGVIGPQPISVLSVNRTQSGGDGPKDVRTVQVPILSSDTDVNLRVLVDHSIVESFGQNGRGVITSRVYPAPEAVGVSLFAEQESVRASITVYALRNCWLN